MILEETLNLLELSFFCSNMGIKDLPSTCVMQIQRCMSLNHGEPQVHTPGGALSLPTWNGRGRRLPKASVPFCGERDHLTEHPLSLSGKGACKNGGAPLVPAGSTAGSFQMWRLLQEVLSSPPDHPSPCSQRIPQSASQSQQSCALGQTPALGGLPPSPSHSVLTQTL